jgi:hypothetical protein
MNALGLELPELIAVTVFAFVCILNAWALRAVLAIDRERDSIRTRDKV